MKKPLLFLDVDGVLCPFGCSDNPPPGYIPSERVPWLWWSPQNVQRLAQLREVYELVWATMWHSDANDVIAPMHSLEPLPVCDLFRHIRHDCDFFAHRTYKLEAVADYAGTRPFAWLEDDLYDDAYRWSAAREAPSLLVRTEPSVGLCDDATQRLLEWSRSPRKIPCK